MVIGERLFRSGVGGHYTRAASLKPSGESDAPIDGLFQYDPWVGIPIVPVEQTRIFLPVYCVDAQ